MLELKKIATKSAKNGVIALRFRERRQDAENALCAKSGVRNRQTDREIEQQKSNNKNKLILLHQSSLIVVTIG